jgi:hypothetical protein
MSQLATVILFSRNSEPVQSCWTKKFKLFEDVNHSEATLVQMAVLRCDPEVPSFLRNFECECHCFCISNQMTVGEFRNSVRSSILKLIPCGPVFTFFSHESAHAVVILTDNIEVNQSSGFTIVAVFMTYCISYSYNLIILPVRSRRVIAIANSWFILPFVLSIITVRYCRCSFTTVLCNGTIKLGNFFTYSFSFLTF